MVVVPVGVDMRMPMGMSVTMAMFGVPVFGVPVFGEIVVMLMRGGHDNFIACAGA